MVSTGTVLITSYIMLQYSIYSTVHYTVLISLSESTKCFNIAISSLTTPGDTVTLCVCISSLLSLVSPQPGNTRDNDPPLLSKPNDIFLAGLTKPSVSSHSL